MFKINVRIKGTTPLLQHRFAPGQLDSLMQGATRKTGATDYSLEWQESMYVTPDGYLCQPASHIEGALVKAAASFGIKGGGRKTWKEPFRAYCYVLPDNVVHLRDGQPVQAPGPDLLHSPTPHLSIDVRRVTINRAAVARSRLMIAEGWALAFTIEVHDEQVQPDIVQRVLEEAGRAVGIGDFRPRYGRFSIEAFDLQQ